jgi:hypothetical protein
LYATTKIFRFLCVYHIYSSDTEVWSFVCFLFYFDICILLDWCKDLTLSAIVLGSTKWLPPISIFSHCLLSRRGSSQVCSLCRSVCCIINLSNKLVSMLKLRENDKQISSFTYSFLWFPKSLWELLIYKAHMNTTHDIFRCLNSSWYKHFEKQSWLLKHSDWQICLKQWTLCNIV